MVEIELSDRHRAVLHAAFNTFVSYGFKRTTMADIADAAGMSRPALYLLFKNKTDIFRAGFVMFVEELIATIVPAVTISAGVATAQGDKNITTHELIRRADEKLYQAKHAGRNCVVA